MCRAVFTEGYVLVNQKQFGSRVRLSDCKILGSVVSSSKRLFLLQFHDQFLLMRQTRTSRYLLIEIIDNL